jgi:hypothetical protein
MNHFISVACCALVKVEGWNSLSIHFLAAASSAQAWLPKLQAIATATTEYLNFIVDLLIWLTPALKAASAPGDDKPILERDS